MSFWVQTFSISHREDYCNRPIREHPFSMYAWSREELTRMHMLAYGDLHMHRNRGGLKPVSCLYSCIIEFNAEEFLLYSLV